jgi:NADPH:quinone reductase-like Zn-dependent oxidoreductase
VDKSFPLREAPAAHERLEKSEQFGKVILNP